MPTYEYECAACNHRFELRRGMRDVDDTACPSCGADTARRVFSVFATSSGGPSPAAPVGGAGGGCACGGACACGH